MVKFDILFITILACLIAVSQAQSYQCQMCTNMNTQLSICTGGRAPYLPLSTIVSMCGCNQEGIDDYADCFQCPAYIPLYDMNTVVTTCQRYGYKVHMPNSGSGNTDTGTNNNGSGSTNAGTNNNSSGSTNADTNNNSSGSTNTGTNKNGSGSTNTNPNVGGFGKFSGAGHTATSLGGNNLGVTLCATLCISLLLLI